MMSIQGQPEIVKLAEYLREVYSDVPVTHIPQQCTC